MHYTKELMIQKLIQRWYKNAYKESIIQKYIASFAQQRQKASRLSRRKIQRKYIYIHTYTYIHTQAITQKNTKKIPYKKISQGQKRHTKQMPKSICFLIDSLCDICITQSLLNLKTNKKNRKKESIIPPTATSKSDLSTMSPSSVDQFVGTRAISTPRLFFFSCTMYIDVCVYIYIYTCIHVCMYTYIHVCMYTYKHVCMHTCIQRAGTEQPNVTIGWVLLLQNVFSY